jgi:hypothetical protein
MSDIIGGDYYIKGMEEHRGRPNLYDGNMGDESRVTVRLPGFLCEYLTRVTCNVSAYIRYLVITDKDSKDE